MFSSDLSGQKILLAVTGSIAAYKSALLARLLMKQGAVVRVIMTPAATRFISPLTLQTLTRQPVYTEIISDEEWNNHVELGLWADMLLIAPATANTLAHMAGGHCDSLVTATYLSARCPVWVAPAMDLDMWTHPSTRRNLRQLEADGVRMIDVGHGELASGLTGDGRMAEPEEITETLAAARRRHNVSWQGRKVLITAGPTYEPLDPVRFLGNHSSGKMGIALAVACRNAGAEVKLICGPVQVPVPDGIDVVRVRTAEEMLSAARNAYEGVSVAIFAAAVADYRPAEVYDRKMKKQSPEEGPLSIKLVQNPDIAAELGRAKHPGAIHFGFALETEEGDKHALRKMENKHFDAIALNYPAEGESGFGADTNRVVVFTRDGERRTYPLAPKNQVAADIISLIDSLL